MRCQVGKRQSHPHAPGIIEWIIQLTFDPVITYKGSPLKLLVWLLRTYNNIVDGIAIILRPEVDVIR